MFDILILSTHLFLLVLDIGMVLWMASLPKVRGEQAFFGMRISASVYRGAGQRILRRYRFWLLTAFVIIEAGSVAASIYMMRVLETKSPELLIVRVLGFLLVVLTTLTVYAFFSRQVRQFEIVQENEPIASSLKTRRLADYTNLGIEALIAIMILIPIMVIAYYYPTLPARLPVRVDWLGEVAEWTEKSFSSLFALPILLAYAQGLFLLFKDGFLRGNMTLPAERADEYYHQMDEGLRVGMRFLDWFRLYLVVPLVGFPIVILFRSPEHAHLITQVGVVFGLIYGTVGLVGLNSYAKRKERIDRRLAAIAGRVLIGRETSTPHFFGGGLFYYNRENPAIFIESPIGGYVLNLGNTAAFVYVASLIGLLLLIAWTLF